MNALIKPVFKGAVAACILLFVFWQISIWFIFMVGINFTVLLFLSIISALMIGGYVTSKNLQARYLPSYLVMGGFTGLLPMILIALILVKYEEINIDTWIVSIVVIVGIVSSTLGSYIGTMLNMRNGHNNS